MHSTTKKNKEKQEPKVQKKAKKTKTKKRVFAFNTGCSPVVPHLTTTTGPMQLDFCKWTGTGTFCMVWSNAERTQTNAHISYEISDTRDADET